MATVALPTRRHGAGRSTSACQQLVAKYSVQQGERGCMEKLLAGHAKERARRAEQRAKKKSSRGSSPSSASPSPRSSLQSPGRSTSFTPRSPARMRFASQAWSAASSATPAAASGSSDGGAGPGDCGGDASSIADSMRSTRRCSSDEIMAVAHAQRERVVSLQSRARSSSIALRRVSEVLLAHLDDDTDVVAVQLSQLESALSDRPAGLRQLRAADPSAYDWWLTSFGDQDYVPTFDFLTKFAWGAGAFLASLVAEDPERAVHELANHSQLASYVSAADAALFFGAFGPLDPRFDPTNGVLDGTNAQQQQQHTSSKKTRSDRDAEQPHILSTIYSVLSLCMFVPQCAVDPGQRLEGLARGAFYVEYTDTPGVLRVRAATRGGGVATYVLERNRGRWKCDGPAGRYTARTIVEVVELLEPQIQLHYAAGVRYSVPWADPRGEVELWGTPAEAEAAARDGTARDICKMVWQRFAAGYEGDLLEHSKGPV